MKTWTRPKIKVQKFVPNFCSTVCFTDFLGGEYWVEDGHSGQSFNGNDGYSPVDDYYNINWEVPTKKYIQVEDKSGTTYLNTSSPYKFVGTGKKPDPNDEYLWHDVEYYEGQSGLLRVDGYTCWVLPPVPGPNNARYLATTKVDNYS